MFCQNCGQKLDDNARFCPSCGSAVVSMARQPNPNPVNPNYNQNPVNPNPVNPNFNRNPVNPNPAYPYYNQNPVNRNPVNPNPVNPNMNPNPAPVARPEGVTKSTKTGLVFALIVTIFFAVGVLGIVITGNPLSLIPLVPAVLLFVPAVLICLINFFGGFKKPKEQRDKKDMRTRVLALIIVLLPVLSLVFMGTLGNVFSYNAAMSSYDDGDYVAAYEAFVDLGDYKDSEQMAERALVRALDGSWRIKGSSAKNHIRIQFDDGSFRADVILDNEVFAPDTMSAIGSVSVDGNKMYLKTIDGATYVSFTYEIKNGELVLTDKNKEIWYLYD